jgi:peptidyl-prolyl cis-trans isomerase SurA
MKSELTAVFLWGLSTASLGAEGVVDRIAAVVNDDVVTLSDIYDLGSNAIDEACPLTSEPSCRQQLESQVLDALIRRALMRQELMRLEYDVGSADVDAAIQQILREYNLSDRDTLRGEVERGGMPWDTYREQLMEQLRVQRFQELVLRSRVSISEEEIRDVYQRRIREIEAPEVTELSAFGFVLPRDVSIDERVKFISEFSALFAAVRSGARTWESVVEEYDTANLARLFEGQSFSREDLNESLATVAFSTPPGGIAEPVLANNIVYGAKVLSRGAGDMEVPDFESIQGELQQAVFRDKLQDAEDEWFEVAKRQAAMKILLDFEHIESEP